MMKTVSEVMTALKKKRSEQTRKIYGCHGAPAEMYGVKTGDLKLIARKIQGQQALALALYETGNADAMHLAGIVADGSKMTKRQLQSWAKSASWYMLSEYTVPGVAVDSSHAHNLALEWIDSTKESVASTGWSTYAGIVAVMPDEELDLAEIRELLNRVVRAINTAPNRVRYTMNGFVIAVGSYVKPLLKQAKATAVKIGTVSVDISDTACKVPAALAYIEKVEAAGRVGKKPKSIKC